MALFSRSGFDLFDLEINKEKQGLPCLWICRHYPAEHTRRAAAAEPALGFAGAQLRDRNGLDHLHNLAQGLIVELI